MKYCRSWKGLNLFNLTVTSRLYFAVMCLLEIAHWTVLMNDSPSFSHSGWHLYQIYSHIDHYYFVLRIFSDFFTCYIGLGGSICIAEPYYTIPCISTQLFLITTRLFIWTFRYNDNLDAVLQATTKDKIFLTCEFLLPLSWINLALLINWTNKRLSRCTHHTPIVTILDENGESERKEDDILEKILGSENETSV